MSARSVGIAIVGCGYVFDLYMATIARHPILAIRGVFDVDAARVAAVTAHYGLSGYESLEALLADETVEIVVNLTSISAHGAVTRAALDAGRHVYCEKPLTTTLAEAEALMALAAEKGLHLTAAPSNVLGATAQTLWKAVADGAVDTPRLVYAEFDDNPVYLLEPETWRSRTGAPWPYLHEYQYGCTWEHAGYHLSWMCAIFGPVRRLTAFAGVSLPDKTEEPLAPADTPDFTVAGLEFESGVLGRLTCSIAAPLDHRARIVGRRGLLEADTYRNYECPVFLEVFTPFTLKARNARAVRRMSLLQRLLGVGGRALPLALSPPPGRDDMPAKDDGRWWHPATLKARLRRRQMGLQDKAVGIAELADAIRTARQPFPPPDYTLHLNELTLAIQEGGVHTMRTRFTPLALPERTRAAAPDYKRTAPGLLARLASRFGK